MIGKEIRSLSQLAKESDSSLRSALILFRERGWTYCKVICIKDFQYTHGKNEFLFIFNNVLNYGKISYSHIISHPCLSNAKDMPSTFGRVTSIPKYDYNSEELYNRISGIVLLPESFVNDYYTFLKNNAKTVRQLISKYGFSEHDCVVKKIYSYTGDSKNFFVWAINAVFGQNTSTNLIKRIFWWNDNYKQLAKKLSRGTITAYTMRRDIQDLFNECNALRIEKRVGDVINTFNTAQKKVLRELELTDDDKKVFSAFYRLSESKKRNFIQKMSTISDPAEIMRQMRHVTSTHFSWNKESFLDFINNAEGIKCDVIYENGDIILVKVNDFDTIKNIAKTTNWCISKNKTYWNQYVESVRDAEQYVMLDFSQKEDSLTSIVGFTCRYNNGITNAHDFVNNNILESAEFSMSSLINSYISHLKENNSIYSLLERNGIDVTIVAKYEKPLYDWNKEAMYKYLYECVDKNNVRILTDTNELVAISVKDKGIKYFIGDSYIDNFDTAYSSQRHIIFMDFSTSQYSPNRLLFAVIQEGSNGNDDYVVCFKNEHCYESTVSFDAKLCQYGLPYDTIKRIDDKHIRLRDAIQSFNMLEVAKSMEDPTLLTETIYDYIGVESMSEYIKMTITNFGSFDYLDIFYNSNHKVSDFIGADMTSVLMSRLLMSYVSNNRNRTLQCPKHNEISNFFNKKTTNINQAITIGIFLAIDKMLSKEIIDAKHNERMYVNLINTILQNRSKGSAIDHFVETMLDNFDVTSGGECIKKIIHYILTYGGKKLREKFDTLKAKSPSLENIFNEVNTGKYISYDLPMPQEDEEPNEVFEFDEPYVIEAAQNENEAFAWNG